MKDRRCLKVVAYFYVPDKSELTNEKRAKYWVNKQPGRLQLYDEKGNKIGNKMIAFDTMGNFLNLISKQLKKMFRDRRL